MHPIRSVALAFAALLCSTPGMAQTPLERGIAAVEAERFQEAIAILTQALDGRQLANEADIGLAYWHRGRAKASLEDCAGAIPDWEKAMALNASPDVYSNLGFCHFQLKEYDEAVPYLGFDAHNFPNAATFMLLGKAQALTDDFDGAEASFRSALELDPDSAEAKQGLAAVKAYRAERAGMPPAQGPQPEPTSAAAPAVQTTDQMLATCRSYNDPARDAQVCFELGKMRTSGSGGLTRDPAAAFWFFSRSCDFGYAEGCIMTGAHYELGRGLPGGEKASHAGAATYYDLACKSDPRFCDATAIETLKQFVRSADAR